jgi:DNA end-binding protein Ku
MAATIWKGYITFGLISIPIRLLAAARSDKVSFNQINRKTGTRVRQQLISPETGEVVDRKDLVKGYEIGKEQYILIEDSEIKKVAPPSTDTMEILEFVKLEEVDPLYFDSSYYTIPEEAGRKAYQLLTRTMAESGLAAIAKISMHQREYTVLIRPRDHGLTLHTMYYHNEIRQPAEYGKDAGFEIKPQEQKLARQLIESLSSSWEPQKYHDQYQARLRELIEAKRDGQEAQPTETRRLAPVIDLMEALQKSLKAQKDTPRKTPAREEQVETTETAEASPEKSRSRKRARKASR